ncbi:putative mediator of RNA polymerase II transcription subunit 29 [Plodia interpunctella]|uniref:putative mediator of RNA polymerase II transcription subunit 29 n=1 Tax=Plodia interpunctella TaxID=58824 RepID=UPI0023679B7F|nr:putative mediator of RNA polymerase II transcription subunit 29 [Plodia interpunctella]
MAPAGKFSDPGAVAVSAVLILLSVSAHSERQCMWCGPLAEQVHRSQRAPPCDRPEQTSCDAGLPHCAIVATSPPYVESRVCVKYYQDECYSIFCNSTRTWRMTCPCRGDLCNKEKTEREYDAFAFLAVLGSKTQHLRLRKRTVTLAKFISQSTNRTTIVNNENKDGNANDEVDKSLQTDKNNMTDISNNDMTSETHIKDSDDLHNENDGDNANNNHNEINNENSTTGIMKDDKNEVTSPPNVIITSTIPAVTESSIGTPQRDPIAEPTTMEPPRKDINMDIVNNIDHVELSATEKSIDKISMKTDIKPSMEMPTAEALQQNSSPSDATPKTQTIVEEIPQTTVIMTTRGNVHVTVTPETMKTKKNNSIIIRLHNLLALFWILLFFV